MKAELRHVGIVTDDPEMSVQFWSDCFGFEVFWDKVEPSPYINNLLGFDAEGLRTIKMRSPSSSVVELLAFPRTHRDELEDSSFALLRVGISHIALTVPNIEACVSKVVSAGALLVSREILAPPNSQVGVVYVLGPDNVYLELVQEDYQGKSETLPAP